MKKTTKKGFFRAIFSRSFVFISLLLLQLLTYFVLMSSVILTGSVKYFVMIIICVFVGFFIINKNENPMYTITWLFLILGFPVFGIFIYIFVKIQPYVRKLKKTYISEFNSTKTLLKKDPHIYASLAREDRYLYNMSNYLYDYSGSIVDNQTRVKYFSDGKSNFEAIKEEIVKAEKFIFVEYFIIEEGVMWNSILDLLVQKAKEGVDVRVMYDGTCSFQRVPTRYYKTLQSMGLKVKVFSPLVPLFTTYQNHRDHRKILVVDGNVAFTGGINLADEYIGLIEPFGKWKDSGIMIEGNAVKDFTLMFLQMWNMKEKIKDNYLDYVSIDSRQEEDGYVIGYGDSPLSTERVGQSVYINMINSAKRYVYIVTPYLVPSYEMIQALTLAAKRGVDVRIILPHIPDKKSAFALAKTYYYPLNESKIKLYEWKPGFVHSKLFVVDDIQATVGSINLDFRSLFLHFECSVFMYKNSQIPMIKADIENLITESILIDNESIKNTKLSEKLLGKLLKLIAPLM